MLVSNAVFNNYLRANGWTIETKYTAHLKSKTEIVTLHQEVDGSVSYKAKTPLGAVYCEGFVVVGYDLACEGVVALNFMGFYPSIKKPGE